MEVEGVIEVKQNRHAQPGLVFVIIYEDIVVAVSIKHECVSMFISRFESFIDIY